MSAGAAVSAQVPWAAVLPVLGVVLLAVVGCLVDLGRRPDTRVLPRWLWAVLCCAFLPWGMVGYLVFGRGERAPAGSERSAEPTTGPSTTPPAPGPRAVTPPVLQDATLLGPTVVRTRHLVCEFPDAAGPHGVGLHGVDLAVPSRGVYGLVGPNGAGKSTLIALLTGLRRPDAGVVELDVPRTRVAVCPDVAAFEPWLTAAEVVALSRQLVHGDSGDPHVQTLLHDTLARTGLTPAADRRVGRFSRGMTQRLGIAAAMVLEPAVLVVDEPTSALDPEGRAEVLTLLAELGRSAAVVFSSHVLADVERIAAHVGVLVEGRLLYQGSTTALVDRHVRPVWRVRLQGDAAGLAARLRRATWVTDVEAVAPGELRVATREIASGGRELARAVADTDLTVLEVSAVDADLETAFRALTAPHQPDPTVAADTGSETRARVSA